MGKEETTIRLLRPLPSIWQEAHGHFAKRVSFAAYQTCFRATSLLSLREGEAIVGVPNDFMKGMIAGSYMPILREVLSQVVNQPVSVRLDIDETLLKEEYTGTFASIAPVEEPPAAPTSVPAAHHDYSLAAARRAQDPGTARLPAAPRRPAAAKPYSSTGISNLNQKYTFSTFVIGSHNSFSHSAALAVAQRPGESYNPLFIYGGVGLGKTHLMHAIGQAIQEHSPNLSIKYLSCERFTNDLINSIRDHKMSDFRKRYRQIDVLLIDDIQFIEGKESTQEEFFHTFNALRDGGKQIVISSDRPPQGLSKLEERLRSRFEWGLISDVQSPDFETRLAILRKKCDQDGINMEAHLLEEIANTFTSNIRELEGALIRLNAFASLTGQSLDRRTINSVLLPANSRKARPVLSVETVIQAVAREYRLEPIQLKSAKRSKDLTLPRHIAMFLAYEMINLSYPRIGEAFGNRKHTSAIYAHTRIKELLIDDRDVSAAVSRIKANLEN